MILVKEYLERAKASIEREREKIGQGLLDSPVADHASYKARVGRGEGLNQASAIIDGLIQQISEDDDDDRGGPE
jgi:hypothetical protein